MESAKQINPKTIWAVFILSVFTSLSVFATEGTPREHSWIWSATPSIARYDYSESLGGIQITSNVLLLKANASRTFGTQDDYEMSGTASASLASFGTSSTGDPPKSPTAPGYYGADLVFSRRSSGQEIGIETYRLKLGFGAQAWGMTVPGNEYGIKLVMGPEFLAQLNSPESAAPPWSAWLKLAPLSEKTITFDLNSYKLSVGGTYRLMKVNKNFLDLTLEIEKISLSLQSSVNQIEVLTYGIGLRYGF